MARMGFGILLGLAMLLAAPASGAGDYWSCADWEAIGRGPEGMLAALGGRTTGCKRFQVRGVDTLNCEFEQARRAFGLNLVEASASSSQFGLRRLSLVFKHGLDRVRASVERQGGLRLELRDGDWHARLDGPGERVLVLTERDDGASQLRCEMMAHAEEALAAVILGRLDWPGAAREPMRVCAVPVDAALPMRCQELPQGMRQFRLDGLVAAEYWVAAMPLDGTRWIAAHGRFLRDCSQATSPGCVAALLTPVRTRAGEVEEGLRIDQRFAEAPQALQRMRSGR